MVEKPQPPVPAVGVNGMNLQSFIFGGSGGGVWWVLVSSC